MFSDYIWRDSVSLARQVEVTVFLDLLAMLILSVLGASGLKLGGRHRQRREEKKRFHGLCATAGTAACFDLAATALYYLPGAWTVRLVMIAKTIAVYGVLCTLYEWLLFVDYKIYGSPDRLKRRYRISLLPLTAMAVLLLTNPFTGLVFTVNADTSIAMKPLYHLVEIMDCLYFFASFYIAYRHIKTGETKSYIGAKAMAVPLAIGGAIGLFIPYHVTPLMLAVGLAVVYWGLLTEWKYDEETGYFYNIRYLSYFTELAGKGQAVCKSVMLFEAEGNVRALCEILDEEKPYRGEMIRLDEGRFLLCIDQDSLMGLELLQQLVEEAVEEYNEASPEDPIRLRVSYQMFADPAEAEAALKGYAATEAAH